MNGKTELSFDNLSQNEEVMYQKMYEVISKEMKKTYGNLVPAESEKDFRIMVPTGDYVIYIHMPFCDTYCKNCPYSKSVDMKLIDEYCTSLITEMDLIQQHMAESDVRPPITLFMGGGTPSVVPIEKLKPVMQKVQDLFVKNAHPEMTIEVNPKSTSIEKILQWMEMGFNRISMGVQSFNPGTLQYYNRHHGPEISEELCKYLSKINFNYNIDLLFGHDGHKINDFLDDLKKAINFGVPHITIYPFHDKGVQSSEKYNKQKDMYEAARELLKKNGYIQYSIVDFYNKNGKPSEYSIQYKQNSLTLGAAAGGSSLEYGSYYKIDDVELYNAYISQGKPAFYKNAVKQKTQVNVLSLYGLKINRVEFAKIYGTDPYLEDTKLFDMLKAIGHIEIDEENITLKNYFRQSQISFYCLFGTMMGSSTK